MQRIPELEYLKDYGESARAVTDISDDAELVSVTDKFKQGGPIVITTVTRQSEEQRAENRRELQETINNAFDDIEKRCKTEAGFLCRLMEDLKIPSAERTKILHSMN